MSAPIGLEIFAGFLMFALLFVSLERWRPLRQQPLFRPGWITDVTYYAAGCFVGHVSDAWSLWAMLWIRKVSRLNFEGVVARQPGWIQFFEILILADFLAYWFHRFLHQFDCLWRLHRVHHSSRQMDWLANVRLHPVDKLLGDCFQFIPIFFMGFSKDPLLAYTIILGFQGFLNHSNIKINYGPLRWVIASPQFHHWHHLCEANAVTKNFAPHLVIFDLIFGTAYFPPDSSTPVKYGIQESAPEGFWGQMIYPLRRPVPDSEPRDSSG